MQSGRSFSGREEHCAFANLGDGTFADISAVSGFDVDDDGRGMALTDFDRDGDVDVWISNRNAPQLRYLENQRGGRFVAVLLEGVAGNRDAIGARVSLTLKDDPRPLLRTVRAGSGFLSQSSRWLHFGLGSGGTIDALTIDWPGGRQQVLPGLQPQKFYRIREGEAAQSWQPPLPGAPLAAAPFAAPAAPSSAAVFLQSGVPCPPLPYATKKDVKTALFRDSLPDARFVLVNLWATWCAPCLEELRGLSRAHGVLSAAGIDVLALNVDALVTENSGEDPGGVLTAMQFPFDWGTAGPSAAQRLQVLHDTVFDLHEPLPVPCSFLFDRTSSLVAVYKGAVNADRVVADAGAATAPAEVRRARSQHFAGRWIAPVRNLSAFDIAMNLYASDSADSDGAGDADRYFERNRATLLAHPHADRLRQRSQDPLRKR